MPVRMLRRALDELPDQGGPLLLDAGSGKGGLAVFMRDVTVMGVDLHPPAERLPNLTFRQGTITELPFPDRSFPLVSCIDVLEYLSLEERDKAIGELVRVASHGVLIACPHGQLARSCDREYEQALLERGKPVPEWITDPSPHAYPTADGVAESVRKANRDARISISYCEPAAICRLVRFAAARSDTLYATVNLCFGLLLPLMRRPTAATGYRMVLFSEVG
jgi:SAM-dependent methyltransferase